MHLKSYWLFFFPMKISYSNCLFCQHQEFKSSFRNHINAMAGLLQQFRFAFSMDYKCEITLSRKCEYGNHNIVITHESWQDFCIMRDFQNLYSHFWNYSIFTMYVVTFEYIDLKIVPSPSICMTKYYIVLLLQ